MRDRGGLRGGAAAVLAGRKVVPMSPVVLVLLALLSMGTLAVARVIRFHFGRTPFPDVTGRFLLILAFLVGPPLVVGTLSSSGQRTDGVASVPVYLVILGAVALVMAIAGLIAGRVVTARARPLLFLALIGIEPDPYAPPVDPPLSKPLAESLATVDAANAAFPRGVEFPAQIHRPGFRPDWDALEAAVRALEDRIRGDQGLNVAVNSRASATAEDARSRVDTLRRMAGASGQEWAQ